MDKQTFISIAVLFTFILAMSLPAYSQQSGTVEGIVKASKTGIALSDVNVIVQGAGLGTATLLDGSFKVESVPTGTYTLRASSIGYKTANKEIIVKAGETTKIEFILLPKATALKEIVVEGRAANLIGIADAASDGRVGRAQLKTRPLLRTGEIMETVPGIITTQHSGSGKANQFFLRGFNLDHGTDFSTSLEGVPLNLRTHAHGQGYLDLNFLIPELIKTVEFEKGPYHADAGDFSTAGNSSISLVSKLEKPIAKSAVGVDDYYRGLVANSSKIKNGNLIYGLNFKYYNGPFEVPENSALFSGLLKYSGGSQSNGYSLSALGYNNDWTSSDQIPRRGVESNQISRFGAIDASDGGKTGRYTLNGNWWNTNENNARTNINVYSTYYRLNLFSNFTYFLDNPTNGDQFEQVDRRLYSGANVSHEWFADWFGQRNTNSVGAELRHDQIFEVGLHNTDDRERFNTIRDDEVAESSAGIYYNNQTQWTDKLRTTIGIRGDLFRFDVNSNIDVNSGTETDFIASPKFGLTLGPWANTEYYLNSGLGYHSNDARGTTIQIDPATGDPVDTVDPLVRSRGAEIGARTTAIDGLQSTLALFYVDLESELVFVGDAGGTEASGASEHLGVEWTNFYQPNEWLILNLDVALTQSQFTDAPSTSDEIPNSIDRIITAGITTAFSSRWNSSLRLRHFGPRPLTEDGSINSESTTLLNFKTGYQFKNVTLELNVLNVLNSEDPDISYFYTSRLQDEPTSGVAGTHFHPVIPRTARLSVAYNF